MMKEGDNGMSNDNGWNGLDDEEEEEDNEDNNIDEHNTSENDRLGEDDDDNDELSSNKKGKRKWLKLSKEEEVMLLEVVLRSGLLQAKHGTKATLGKQLLDDINSKLSNGKFASPSTVLARMEALVMKNRQSRDIPENPRFSISYLSTEEYQNLSLSEKFKILIGGAKRTYLQRYHIKSSKILPESAKYHRYDDTRSSSGIDSSKSYPITTVRSKQNRQQHDEYDIDDGIGSGSNDRSVQECYKSIEEVKAMVRDVDSVADKILREIRR